jgi:hypothetical protein
MIGAMGHPESVEEICGSALGGSATNPSEDGWFADVIQHGAGRVEHRILEDKSNLAGSPP